jgi:hypothetical protein
MIPAEKMAAVRLGLREAFGVDWFDDVELMAKGQRSALVFRMVRMPALVRAVQTLPPLEQEAGAFHTSCLFLLKEGPALEGFLEKVRGVEGVPQDDMDALFAVYERVKVVYPCGSEMVVGHNDRYADLAMVTNLIVASEAEECAYLMAYLGVAPDAYQRARFFLMRQLTHIFNAMVFLYLGSLGERVDWSAAVPPFEEYQRQFWAGEVRLEDGPSRVLYAQVHLNQIFENAWSPRFGEAVRIVGTGRA